MILGLTYYQMLAYFVIYAFLGWVLEVAYHALKLGIVANRGFLCGPICPVYGFGMVGILMTLKVVEDAIGYHNVIVTFFTGMVVCSLIELFAGWMLMVFFHARWWDYSEEQFNLNGFICLKFSVYWGFATMMAVDGFHPMIAHLIVEIVPQAAGWASMAVIYIGLWADAIVTVLAVIGMDKKIAEINTLRSEMRIVSDELTERIATSSISTKQTVKKIDAFVTEQKNITTNNIGEIKDDVSRLVIQSYSNFLDKNFVVRRMIRVFPNLKHRIYPNAIKEMRDIQTEK